MIERSDIFSTPVWHIKDVPSPLVDELYDAAYKIKENSTEMIDKSNQEGFQSIQYEWKDFYSQGKEYITSVVDNIFKNYEMKGWWYNINPKGSWNTAHAHPGSDFVLIIYLTDSDGLLYLLNPNIHRIYIGDTNQELANPNVKKGEMIIFPGDIVHYVNQNKKETDRICISMNIKLK